MRETQNLPAPSEIGRRPTKTVGITLGEAIRHGLRAAVALLAASALMAAAGTPRHLEDALAAQRALVEENPYDLEVLNDLGNLLALGGHLMEAEETYRRALQIDAEDVTSRYNLALVLQELGRPKEALRELDSVVRLQPDHAWAHYQLGTLYASRRRSKAIEHYKQAFALDRSLTDPSVNPHIVENPLVTEVLLRVYLSGTPSTQAPRLYRQPGEVAAMLLPRRAPEPPQQPVDATEESEREPRYRGSFQDTDPDEAQEGDDEQGARAPEEQSEASTRVLDETAIGVRRGTAPGSAPRQPSATRRPRTEAQPPPQGGEGSQPAEPATPPRVRSAPSKPFRPALPSTGRLDLELFPQVPRRSETAPS